MGSKSFEVVIPSTSEIGSYSTTQGPLWDLNEKECGEVMLNSIICVNWS